MSKTAPANYEKLLQATPKVGACCADGYSEGLWEWEIDLP